MERLALAHYRLIHVHPAPNAVPGVFDIHDCCERRHFGNLDRAQLHAVAMTLGIERLKRVPDVGEHIRKVRAVFECLDVPATGCDTFKTLDATPEPDIPDYAVNEFPRSLASSSAR